MRRQQQSFNDAISEALSMANTAETIKQAEVAAVREATPVIESELAALLRKTAATVRTQSKDVTYDDLQRFMEGRL